MTRDDRRRSLARALMAATAIVGCTPDGTATLLVDVRTDLLPGDELTTVRTELVRDGDGERFVEVAVQPGDDLVGGQRVAQLEDVALGDVEVRVRLLDARGAPRLSRTVAVRLTADASVTAVLARSCLAVRCPSAGDPPTATECQAGRCVSPECSVETPEACPEPECAADGDCEVASACAVGRCADGACLAQPDDGRCGPAERCHPADGCQPLPDADAGAPTPDGGSPEDGGAADAGERPDAGPGFDGGATGSCEQTPDGWRCDCPAGSTCVFPCREGVGGCHASCAADTDCTLDCGDERDCSMTCQAPSDCTPGCPTGMCVATSCFLSCTYTCSSCDAGT